MTDTLISVLKAVSDELAGEADLATLMDFDSAAEEEEEVLRDEEDEAEAYPDDEIRRLLSVIRFAEEAAPLLFEAERKGSAKDSARIGGCAGLLAAAAEGAALNVYALTRELPGRDAARRYNTKARNEAKKACKALQAIASGSAERATTVL